MCVCVCYVPLRLDDSIQIPIDLYEYTGGYK